MTEACRDWRGVLGAAALGRIDPAEEIGLRAHLDGCALCRAELRELAAVAGALDAVPVSDATSGVIAEPSGALAGRVLDRVARERKLMRARRGRRVGAGVAAFVSAAAVVIGVVVVMGGGGPSGMRVVLPGVGGERASATATATLRSEHVGTEVDVKVSGLHPGDYYWLWVTGDDGRRIPAGTFQGSVEPANLRLMAALPLSEARRIWVTDAHDQVVLDARVPAPT